MAPDISRYGQAELGGAFYLVRDPAAAIGRYFTEVAASVHIDGLGKVEPVASAAAGKLTREQIARLPTLDEARAQHLEPAFREAAENSERWAAAQEQAGRDFDAPPPRLDPATARFLADDD